MGGASEPSVVREVYEGNPESVPEANRTSIDNPNMGFSMLETPEHAHLPDPAAGDKFRATFAFDEKETLLTGKLKPFSAPSKSNQCFMIVIPGYLFRVLPVYGKIYISTNYFCFRASQPLSKTKVIIAAQV